MMTARFAVGSVSTLAMGALLLGSGSFLLNRSGMSSHAAPWGDISSLSTTRAAAASTDDQAQLLKLAALQSGTGTAAATSESTPATTPTVVPAVDTSASVQAAPPPAAPSLNQSADAAAPSPTPASAPVQMASAADDTSVEAPASAEESPAVKSSLLNLNTASTDALDHMGAGHVGRAIVAHRPYRSIKDLVSRRVLRTTDYQKIASRISVD